MEDFKSNNDKQKHFSIIKGTINQLNDSDNFCSITLHCGHENPRPVNLITNKPKFDLIKNKFNTGDKVQVKYYLRSQFKNNRWFTSANILFVDEDNSLEN